MGRLFFDRIAHRGVSAEYPENSMAAFEAAVKMGCAGIELDVHLSADEIPVVVHDAKHEEKWVSDTAAADLGVPLLSDVVAMHRGDSVLMVELKEGNNPPVELVERSLDALRIDSGDWWLGSLCVEIVGLIRERTDRVMGIAEDIESIAQYLEWSLPILAIDRELATNDVCERILGSGATLWVWTVDDPDEAVELVDRGVQGIITNDPRRM